MVKINSKILANRIYRVDFSYLNNKKISLLIENVQYSNAEMSIYDSRNPLSDGIPVDEHFDFSHEDFDFIVRANMDGRALFVLNPMNELRTSLPIRVNYSEWGASKLFDYDEIIKQEGYTI